MSSTFAQTGRLSLVHTLIRRQRPRGEARPTERLGALRALDGWTVIDTPPFNFIDHVVIGPGAVLAVSYRHWLPLEGEAGVRRSWQNLRTALGATKLMRNTLADDTLDLTPVLMIDGPGAPELPDGHMLIKGVHVVDPHRPQLWLHLFQGHRIDDVTHRRLANQLRSAQYVDSAVAAAR
jgi:hypothetical protein